MNLDVEKIVREYIQKTPHMSLATVGGDKPWVCEVHFAYDDDLNLYFRSRLSTRHCQELAVNPNVAGNIVRQHALDEYPHAIYFEGTAELVTDYGLIEKIFPYFEQQQGSKPDAIEESKGEDGHKFHKISVKNWYAFGKFGGDKGQKYKLEWSK